MFHCTIDTISKSGCSDFLLCITEKDSVVGYPHLCPGVGPEYHRPVRYLGVLCSSHVHANLHSADTGMQQTLGEIATPQTSSYFKLIIVQPKPIHVCIYATLFA